MRYFPGKSSLTSAMAFMALVSLCAGGCGKKPDAGKQMPASIVTTAVAVRQDAPLRLDAIGNVIANNSVDIKSRVTGQLINTLFKQGEYIEEGRRLFVIDPAPFEAKVRESEAKVNQSKVVYDHAAREFHRFKGLMQEKVVSQEQFEQREVDMNSKRYQYELNRAELDTAKLNLGYCYIDSPLSGESGKALIDNFNIVTANQDALVNIKQLRPIRVRFSVPEKYLAEIRKYREQNPLEVEAHIPGAVEPEKGTLSFVDNSTNLKTGAVMLEALFPNPEVRLWPGLFVEVRLLLTVTKDATLVPAEAVMEGPHGRYVWVVDTEQTVSMKPVKSDRRIGAMTMLAEGVEPGEIVVTDGQMMLRPGGKTITKAQAEQMMLKGPPAAGSAPGPANRPGAGK